MQSAYSDGANAHIKHAWIELTNTCNLKCSHCYTSSAPHVVDHDPVSLTDKLRLLDDLRELGCSSLSLIGGEATLSPELTVMISEAASSGFSVELYSNLIKVTDNIWDAVAHHKVRLATSIYSIDPATHDLITGRRGSHVATVCNVRHAVGRQIPVRASMIVLPSNEDQIEDTKAFALSLGIYDFGVDRAREFGRHADNHRTVENPADELCGRCCDNSICVSPSGEVSPCIMSKAWSLGSIRGSSIIDLVRSGSLRKMQSNLSRQFAEREARGILSSACGPEDKCNPGACKPQIDGPPDCSPKTNCTPWVVADRHAGIMVT